MAGEAETKTAEKGPGMMTLIKAVALISVFVLLQIVGASMIIPSAEETAAIAGELATADSEQTEDAGETDSAADDEERLLLAAPDMIEVSLGSFHILSYNPTSGNRTNVDFDLFATVLDDEESKFFDLFAANEHRIREQVQVIVRGTEITGFTDPTLGLIKRKILEKTNRALSKPLLHEVIFSKFSFEER